MKAGCALFFHSSSRLPCPGARPTEREDADAKRSHDRPPSPHSPGRHDQRDGPKGPPRPPRPPDGPDDHDDGRPGAAAEPPAREAGDRAVHARARDVCAVRQWHQDRRRPVAHFQGARRNLHARVHGGRRGQGDRPRQREGPLRGRGPQAAALPQHDDPVPGAPRQGVAQHERDDGAETQHVHAHEPHFCGRQEGPSDQG